ncbi:MAG: FAD-dependent oxidoreductase, partial [Acidimicrobiia bacterium]|nr:FAD-dependent oxidoreductase [Acidimicrobiia bacterium]
MRPRVVVIGAGFGGIGAATRLADLPVDTTIVDQRNHHVFQPLLYQVATAGLAPSDIALPVRGIFQDDENVDFRWATVER